MTVEDVRRRVEEIRAESDDDEMAHSMQDKLHQDVLREIASGSQYSADLAEEALKTKEIDFSRWCA